MLLILACAAVCLGICLPLFGHYRKINRPLGAAYKSLGSCCAVILAVVAAVKLDRSAWICVSALAACAIADWLLETVFSVGMGVFGAGHILFTAWYLSSGDFSLTHVLCILCMMAIGFFVFLRWHKQMGKNTLPFGIYCTLLCIMSGSGIATGFLCFSTFGWLTAAGAVLFAISDCMVCRKILFPASKAFGAITMIVYYSALLCIGGACLYL